jgi:hypothetical protein
MVALEVLSNVRVQQDKVFEAPEGIREDEG